MQKVFLAYPQYGEELNAGAARGIFNHASDGERLHVIPAGRSGSLIPGSCNALWCDAMNLRDEHGLTWFAMLHADIAPEAFWLDKLVTIAEERRADMLSVCVPIKDHRGVTSTAIAGESDKQMFCRITQRQLWHESFPETFDIYECADALERLPDGLRIPHVPRIGLRLNTGCMITRLDRPWIGCDPPKVWFDNPYWIERHDGLWRARDVSEDWRFAQKVQEAGGKLLATRAVKLEHKGLASFPNDEPWGLLASDHHSSAIEKETVAA